MYTYLNRIYMLLVRKADCEPFVPIRPERTIFDYLHNCCLNRLLVVCNPSNPLFPHSMTHKKALKLLIRTFNKPLNNEEKFIWNFAQQGFEEIRH